MPKKGGIKMAVSKEIPRGVYGYYAFLGVAAGCLAFRLGNIFVVLMECASQLVGVIMKILLRNC